MLGTAPRDGVGLMAAPVPSALCMIRRPYSTGRLLGAKSAVMRCRVPARYRLAIAANGT